MRQLFQFMANHRGQLGYNAAGQFALEGGGEIDHFVLSEEQLRSDGQIRIAVGAAIQRVEAQLAS